MPADEGDRSQSDGGTLQKAATRDRPLALVVLVRGSTSLLVVSHLALPWLVVLHVRIGRSGSAAVSRGTSARQREAGFETSRSSKPRPSFRSAQVTIVGCLERPFKPLGHGG